MLPPAATISVADTLAMLDGPKKEIAEGVANDRYAFWLGSGISRNRMPDLRHVAKLVMLGLHQRIEVGNPACRFRSALEQVVTLASPGASGWAKIDLALSPDQWEDFEDLAERLVTNYARMLGVIVEGEEFDYLLWDVIDAANLYADDTIMPDAEHLCLAALGIEGVASAMPSANWDTLIERSFVLLAGDMPVLRVAVAPMELRDDPLRGNLYKFHGCAGKARTDGPGFRRFLIATQDQINAWQASNVAMANHLVAMIVSRPTLMLGLSAQDANIQGLFATAQDRMEWPWPCQPPAYAFSENALGVDQQGLLRNVYRGQFTPATRQAITEEALVQAFAKPLLLALYLYVVAAKLRKLVGHASLGLGDPVKLALEAGLIRARNALADRLTPDADTVLELLTGVGRAIGLLRQGALPTAPEGIYSPVTPDPLARMPADQSLAGNGVCQFAAALALVGLGIDRAGWEVGKADLADPTGGAMTLTSDQGAARVYFAANAQAAIRLGVNGLLAANDDIVIIHSHDIVEPMPRTPSRSIGRSGVARVRSVGMNEVLGGGDTDGIWERFQMAIAL